jgi:hypothetical protein
VASKAGARVGEEYVVRGKLRNAGAVAARRIRVRVRLLDGSRRVLGVARAEAPRSLEPGGEARFEASYSGPRLDDVARIEVEVRAE